MLKDISGCTFGKLTVVGRVANDKHNKARWLCRCDCGNEKIILGSNLLSGRTTSCGCVTSPDLTGLRYGRLTVIKRSEGTPRSYGHSLWVCHCDCGKEALAYGTNLTQGRTQSCGCYQADAVRLSNSTHGESHTRLHRIWLGMKDRCYNKNAKNYQHYGGRGIFVCDEWLGNFESFRDWAISNGYSNSLSIDRVNVDGSYEPTNCRWATAKEQNNNKRNNRQTH